MGNDMTTIDNDMDNLVSAFNDDDTATSIREFIDGLTRQKKIMQKVVIKLATGRVKSGSVVYYIPVPSLHKEVEVLDTDKTLMKDFSETVKAHNENVLNQFREAQKLISPSEEQDLSADFNVKSA